MSPIRILIFYFFFFSTTVYSQSSRNRSVQNFDDVLSTNKTGKVIIKKVGKDISQRTFLGTIKDNQGHIKYYVVKEFLRIQAAIVYHGHSSILFFNDKKKLVKEAILNLPEELPFKLVSNFLYFKYLENGSTRIFKEKIEPLPEMICVQPNLCYSVANILESE